MLGIDQDDRCTVQVRNDCIICLATERLIQRRTDAKEADKLTLNKRSVVAPSGMSCGSKANARPLNRVPVTLRGVVSARGSCDIVERDTWPTRGLVDELRETRKFMAGS